MLEKVVKFLVHKPVSGLLTALLVGVTLLLAGPGTAQAASTATVTTNHWKEGNNQGYSLTATVFVDDTSDIPDVTITGPHLTKSYQLVPDSTLTVYSVMVDLTGPPTTSDVYSFKIDHTDPLLLDENITARPTGVVANFATVSGPAGALTGSVAPDFSWTAPGGAEPAGGYRLTLTGIDIPLWSADLAPAAVSAAYSNNGDPTLPATFTTGIYYTWSIFALDDKGNSSEVRNTFMLGTNFSGKVTLTNGGNLSDVTISVFTAANGGGLTFQQPIVGSVLADGSYMYGGLASGNYTVTYNYNDSNFTDGHVRIKSETTYYNNTVHPPGDTLSLSAGTLLSGIDAVLGDWGMVSGPVFLTDSANRPAQATVTLYDANHVAPIASVPPATVTLDNGFGNFELTLVPPGVYAVKFSAQGYTPVWMPVTVAADTIASTFATLDPAPAGKIGDCNGDGSVDALDLQYMINVTIKKPNFSSNGFCDVNLNASKAWAPDSSVDALDIQTLVNVLIKKSGWVFP